jgi:DNA-binding MarR family transcriptional regulator
MQPPNHVGYWLSRARRSVGAAVGEVLRAHCAKLGKPYVVTPPQWGVLATLAANGEVTVSALSQLLAVETPDITGLVTRLEQNSLVERVHDRDDRRLVKVSLTTEGRRIVRSLNPVMAQINDRLLPPDQAPAFVMQLKELIVRASALAPAKSGQANALPAVPTFQQSKEK